MLKLTQAIHTHTVYSHGKSTIEENVKEAVKLNMERIVISEHGPGHIYGKKITNSLYREMKETIVSLREKYPQIEILMGLEANIISVDGDIDANEELLDMLDVLYIGFHTGIVFTGFKNYYSIAILNILNKKFKFKFLDKKCIKINTSMLEKAIEKYSPKMIVHPTSRFNIDYIKIADICEEKGILMEINSGRKKLDAEELKALLDHKVKFLVGTDAHYTEDIGNWETAEKNIKESGIPLDRILNVKQA